MTGWTARTVYRDGIRLVARDYGDPSRPASAAGDPEQVTVDRGPVTADPGGPRRAAGTPPSGAGRFYPLPEAQRDRFPPQSAVRPGGPEAAGRGDAGRADPGGDPRRHDASVARQVPAAGTPSTLLLLHGLAGHSGEWDATACLLTGRHRVVAVDQRGQGASERRPRDMSRSAYVEDVVAVIQELELDDVVLVGQSLGGHTAMLTAATHPELVRALVMVEAGPGTAEPDPREKVRIGEWLASWPVPFPSPAVAAGFFGGGPVGAGWAAGLEEREDGWWPRFEPALMADSLTELTQRSFRHEWEQVACPTLVVLAESGIIPSEEVYAMTRTRPGTVMVQVPGAGHDLHLEAPDMLHTALTDFLEAL
jgi:pimeloyl-ACP methyl ester carboxylesterase